MRLYLDGRLGGHAPEPAKEAPRAIILIFGRRVSNRL